MPLYVVPVPSPAAGADWSFTVPGQFTYDIVGITATLNTAIPPTTLVDSSPNGRDASIVATANYTLAQPGPFGGGAANLAAHCDGNILSPDQPALGVTTPYAAFGPGTLSWDCWINFDSPIAHGNAGIFGTNAVYPNANGNKWRSQQVDAAHWGLRYFIGGSLEWSTGTLATAGGWHHLACTYDGTNWRIYVDGALASTQAVPFVDTGTDLAVVFGDQGNTTAFGGYLAGFGFYSGVTLSGGQVAAHAAASGSAAAYKAAVLADSPAALWMLGDTVSRTSRTVALDITDGTHVVQEIPSGFPVVTTTGPITFSWQSNLNSSTQVPTATTTTVAIPELILPSGYTVGTRTLDLAATDQWSNINVWWNSGYQDATNPLNEYRFPGGIRLVYQQERT